jgi:hypothetical protein
MKLRLMSAFLGTRSFAVGILFLAAQAGAASDNSLKQARVSRVIRDVKLLPSEAKPRPAAVNDKVSEGTGVRTGDNSRSELTFVDLTITRLGANTVFSFDKAGRIVDLGGGSVLLRVPKDSGGGSMSTPAVTIAITGTTVILEATRTGRNRLTVLEGGARLSLKNNARESVYVRGGQREDVPAGATKLPPPVNVDLDDIMKNNPLITDFPPLPSRDLIYATRSNPSGDQAQPVDGGSTRPGPVSVGLPILPGLVGTGIGLLGGGGRHTDGKHRGQANTTRQPSHPVSKTSGSNTDHQTASGMGTGHNVHASPSPTPTRGRKASKDKGNG